MTYIPKSAVAIGGAVGAPVANALTNKPEPGIIDTLVDAFVGRTRSVVNLATQIPGFSKEATLTAQQLDGNFAASKNFIEQARKETDPIKKEQWLQKSRDIDAQSSAVSDNLQKETEKVMAAGKVTEEDLSRSNMDFAIRRGAGVAGEVGALALPYSKPFLAMSKAAQTAVLTQKMMTAGLAGGAAGALLGVTDPQAKTVGDRFSKGLTTGAVAFISSAAITGALEIGKNGLQAAGRRVASLIPKHQAAKTYASSFNIPNKLAARLKPIETSQQLADDGVYGTFDVLQTKAKQVTGGTGAIDDAVYGVLNSIDDPIDSNEALTAAREVLELPDDVGGEEVERKLLLHIQKIISGTDKGNTTAGGQKNALAAWDAIKALEKQGYAYMGKSTYLTPNIQAEAKAEVYLAAAEALKEQINKLSVSKEVIERVTRDERLYERLAGVSPKLAERFFKAGSLDEIRKLASPYVRLSKMIDISNSYQTSPLVQSIVQNAGITTKAVNAVTQSTVFKQGTARALNSTDALMQLLSQASGQGAPTQAIPLGSAVAARAISGGQ